MFDLSFDRVFQSWSNTAGKEFEDLKKIFKFDEFFDKFEKNEISPEEFRAKISQQLNLKLTDKEFDKGWCDLYLETYSGIDDLLMNLKRNYKLVALTNTNLIHNKVWRVKYADILLHFEKIFCSHEMGTRKPEENAYKMVLDYLQCTPAETFFIDDNIDNINGAKQLGITSILVTSQEQMSKDLKKLSLLN